MKKKLSALIALLLLITTVSGLYSCSKNEKTSDIPDTKAGKTYYVDFSASAGGDGSESKPFATISEAQNAIRELKKTSGLPDGGIDVIISGAYHQTESFTFTAEDSGEAGKPITYKAGKNGAVIDGGTALKAADFKPAGDDVKALLVSDEAKANVLEIDLAAAGCTDLDEYEGNCYQYRQELYVGYERQTVARWPNEGYATVVGPTFTPIVPYFTVVDTETATRWAAEKGSIRTYMYPEYDWRSYYGKVDTIEPDTGKVIFDYPNSDASYDRPYFVENLLCELDTAGEYYWDVEAKKLYYWPVEGWEDKEISFSQLFDSSVEMTDTSYVTLEGIIFQHMRNYAVKTSSSTNTAETCSKFITVDGCTVRAMGENAIEIRGMNSEVNNCEIYNLGAGGIRLMTHLSDDNMESSYNRAYNNLIHDWAQIYTVYNCAIRSNGFGTVISHNEMYNSPHEAIEFVGDTIIEYNHIHHVCTETNDASAIYSGRRWDWDGTIIRYNYIHDVLDTMHGRSPNAIYLDDSLSGQTIYGNVIANIGGVGVAACGGKDTVVENNIFINVACCTGRTGWTYVVQFNDREGSGADYSNKSSTLWESILARDYQNSKLWRYSVPQLYLILEIPTSDELLENYPATQSHCICNSNLNYNSAPDYMITYEGEVLLYDSFYDNIDYHDTDPGFVDAENGNYNLREDSRVWSDMIHFEAIPFDEIGRVK